MYIPYAKPLFTPLMTALACCLLAALVSPVESSAETSLNLEAVIATPPEEWSEELKAQIVAAGYDLAAIEARARRAQGRSITRSTADGGGDLESTGDDGGEQAATDPATSRRSRSRGTADSGEDLEPTANDGEEQQARTRSRTRTAPSGDSDAIDWDAIIATPSAEWSEATKEQIIAAGYDPEAIAERIRRAREKNEQAPQATEILAAFDTAVEDNSWGRIKAEISTR